MASRAIIAASIVATIAFAAYTRTLLPGVDLGDTGGFQAAVLWPEISARQAYPLYYALAKPFVAAVAPDNPARGLNLFSALCAGVAAGLLTGVVAHVTGSIGGGVVAGLLLAFSYTFWTQAIIAEVYALHLAIVGCCLAALVAWAQRPSTARLALFFAIFAAGFGNHLSMILLLVPCAVFILTAARQPSDVLHRRVIIIAVAIAAAGSLQYIPHLLAVWRALDAPESWTERIAAFWFDVTKSDWRESMVMGVNSAELSERAALFAFDARQQFGIAGLLLGAAGLVALWRMSWKWALFVLLAYVFNSAFAFTYNVGDPHVFFLPGHYFVAFMAGAATAAAARAAGSRRPMAALAVLGLACAYAAWRAYDTWPAADRHDDRRAERLVTRLTAGLDERAELLASRMNWQVENALLYETRYRLRHVAWIRLGDVLLHFPLLVQDNHAAGRDVVLTAGGVPSVVGAFGPLFPIVPDPSPPAVTISSYAARIPPGALYALALVRPSRDEVLDTESLVSAGELLTAGSARLGLDANYEVVIGRSGEAPLLHRKDKRPFRDRLVLPEGVVEVRIDGWVPAETFRRAGFGHVFLNRRRVLTVERGLSAVAFAGAEPFYQAGVYALQPRFRIPSSGVPELALLH